MFTHIVNVSLEKHSVIHGHHYKDMDTRYLVYEREPTNLIDRHVVDVAKDNVIVGHLPRAQSKIYSLFLFTNGTIDGIVMGATRYSVDLPQGELKVPCKLVFNSKHKEMKKLKCLLARKTVVNKWCYMYF